MPMKRIKRVPLYRRELTTALNEDERWYGARVDLLRSLWFEKYRNQVLEDIANTIYRQSEHKPKSQDRKLLQLRQEVRRVSIKMDEMKPLKDREWEYLAIDLDKRLDFIMVTLKPIRVKLNKKAAPWDVAFGRIKNMILLEGHKYKTLEKWIQELRGLLHQAEQKLKERSEYEADLRNRNIERLEQHGLI